LALAVKKHIDYSRGFTLKEDLLKHASNMNEETKE